MNFKEYQELALTTDVSKDGGPPYSGLPYYTLGLNGEAGEVAEKVKKLLRGDYSYNKEFISDVMKELGDILWYIAGACNSMEVDLQDVARWNLEKLQSRKKRNKLQGDGDNR